MEWDFSDISAMSEPKKKVWDFSDISAMGSEPKKNEWDFSDISAMGNAPVPTETPPIGLNTPSQAAQLPGRQNPHPPVNQEVIRDFLPAVAAGENTFQLNKAIGDLSQREYVEENPIEAGLETLFKVLSGGLPKQAKTDEQLAALEQEVAERQKVQDSQRVIGTKDVDGAGDALSLVTANVGASTPAMLRSIASGGTMTPDIMSNEINANLADIEDLSSKDRRALSKGGGIIAATLENIGLGYLIKGVPPGVFAKMGLNKTAELIERSVTAKVVSKGGVASLTEGITEGGQEATGIGAELIAGKEFAPGEIAERVKEAVKLGAVTGGALATGGSATVEGLKKVGEITPNTGTSLDDPGLEDDGLSGRAEPELDVKSDDDTFTDGKGQKWVKLPSEITEEKFTKKIEDVTPETNTDEAVDTVFKYLPEKEETKTPVSIRKKVTEEGGDQESEAVVEPAVEPVVEAKEIPAEPSPETVSTPPEGGVSPAVEPDLPPVIPPQEVDTVQDDTVQDTDQGESNGDVAAEVGVEPEVEAGPKKVAKKDFAQKILAKKQEEEFDRLADGIEPDEEGINLTDEDKALQEEEELMAAKYKDGRMQFTPYPNGGTREERKAWRVTARQEMKEANENVESFKGRTVKEVTKEVESAIGKRTLKKLTKNGAVTILQSEKDWAKEDGVSPINMGKNISGAYVPKTGKVYIIAENSPRGTAGGTILHEVGEHAALEQMVGEKQYEDISKSFDKLLEDGDEIAVLANSLVPKDTLPKRLKAEQLAYLIQSVENKKTRGEKISSKSRNLVSRLYNLIRKWFQNLPAYRKFASRAAFSKLESGEFLSPENITSLARAAVDYHAEGKTQINATFTEDSPAKEGKSRQFTDLVKRYLDGDITHEQLIEKQNERSPIKPFESVPVLLKPKQVEDLIRSQHSQRGVDRGIIGVNKPLTKAGDPIATRIDIKTFVNKGEYVVTLHSKPKGGEVLGYSSAIWMESPKEGGKVEFYTDPKRAIEIALDEKSKSTFARIWGDSKGKTQEEAHAQAEAIMDGTAPDADQWQQVHMNPERASYFYDMDGNPVVEADEVIQVGGLVYVKGAETTTIDDSRFTANLKERGEIQFSKADPEVETGPEPKLGESKFVNVTESITAAHGKKKKPKVGMLGSIWDATVETATVVKDQMTRSHKLLDPKKFGKTTDYLRLMQETGSYAKHKAYTDVYSVIGKMNDKEQLILSMNMILPDMLKDIKSGLLDAKVGLPFGYKSVKDVKVDLDNFQDQAEKVGADPSTDVDINASIKKRTEFMKNLREELVAEGLLRKELANDDRYFHHQVLEYLNMEDAGYTSSVQKPGIRETKKGWQKSRTGSTKDYNTKYLDAEFEVLSQSRQQLEAKRLLNKIKIANDKSSAARKLRTELNAKRTDKKENELSLEQTLKQSEEFDGYVVWEPNDKGVFYQTYSVADKVAQQILEDGGAEVTKVQKVFAKGAKEKWVIPAELAETLNTPTKNENEAWPFSWSRKGIRAWKVWTLLNPFRILRYNLNNMSGDLDIALAYDPKMILGMKKSIKDLLLDRKNPNSKASEELNEARRWGIIDSGFVITEVDDFSKMYEGLFDPKPSNNLEKLTQAGKNIPKNFREWTTYRENIIRLTAWRYFKKKIKDNPDKKIYAASKQSEIDQITDPDQKAAKLARELIGDYGNISHAGRAIRSHLMPFYSWMEINAPRYIRLVKNSKDEGNDIKAQLAKVVAKQTGTKLVGVTARMAIFSTFVSAYNAAFFPDEEEKLSEFERQQLHIILGTWDGEITTLRFQGAFSDFVSWASLHDLPSDLVDLAKGEKSVIDQMKEMAKAPALKLAAGLSPLYKVPAEFLSGESYWPDFLNPRPIRDRFEHIANAFSLGTVYKQLAGKPNKGFGEWSKLLISSTDPGESAYYKNWEKVRKWRDKLGKDDVGSFSPTTKSNALYYYKQAMKYQDMEAAWKYYVKYINLSGGVTKDGKVPKKTLKNIERSIKRANPLSRIPAGTWKDFQKTLSQGEKKTWNTGIKWYEKTYKKK